MIHPNLFEMLYDSFEFKKSIRLIELFAGYGSQAMALKRLQNEGLLTFEHHKVVEFDKYAIKSYNAIHNTNYEMADIRDVKGNDLEITDKDKYTYVMTYSFPCQDLSKAGKQRGMKKGDNTRSGLLWEVGRILGECWNDKQLPDILLMENVPDVIGQKNYADFMQWYAALEACGYQSYYTILNAKDFGVPQNRARCFMISILGNYNYSFPQGFTLEKRLKDLLEENVDEKYYISEEKIKYMKETNFNTSSYDVVVQDKDDICRTLCARDYKDPKCVKVGELNLSKFESCNRVYSIEGLSPTVDTAQGGNREIKIYDENRYRKLTPREYGRLMGVSEEDITKMLSVNSNSQCYKQFGNSIVVDVLYYIFKQMC